MWWVKPPTYRVFILQSGCLCVSTVSQPPGCWLWQVACFTVGFPGPERLQSLCYHSWDGARGGCRWLTAGESCQYSLMLQSLHLLNSSCRSSRGSVLQTSCGVTGTSSLGRGTHQTDIVGSCCCWWPRRSAPPSHRKLASEPRRRPGRRRGAERVWPQEICRVSHHHRALYTEQRSAGSKWICGLKRGLTPRHLFSV